MTSTHTPAAPASRSRAHTAHVGAALLRGLLRGGVLVTASALLGALLPSGDALGSGLTELVLVVAVAGSWAIYDGWRGSSRTGIITWGLAAVLYLVLQPLPLAISRPASEGGWSGLDDYLAMVADSSGFIIGLVLVPALVGLFLGALIRPKQLADAPR